MHNVVAIADSKPCKCGCEFDWTCNTCNLAYESCECDDDTLDDPGFTRAATGSCAWNGGAYGRIGTVHYARTPDGTTEECCTFA